MLKIYKSCHIFLNKLQNFKRNSDCRLKFRVIGIFNTSIMHNTIGMRYFLRKTINFHINNDDCSVKIKKKRRNYF